MQQATSKQMKRKLRVKRLHVKVFRIRIMSARSTRLDKRIRKTRRTRTTRTGLL